MDIKQLTLADLQPWSQLLATCFDRQAADMAQLIQFLQPASRLITWGAWDGPVLAAQYSCWLTAVHNPGCTEPLPVGMSINMAVHPTYRGRGLVKQVAEPVYAALAKQGAVAGVGFSNAQGVQVDRHSKGYGYEVVGQLRPSLFYVQRGLAGESLVLDTKWPERPFASFPLPGSHSFHHSPPSLRHRFAQHPFRQYCFGIWEEQNEVIGLVVYRQAWWGRLPLLTLLFMAGQDMAELCRRWLTAVSRQGFHLVHALATPDAQMLSALKATAVSIPLPYSRTPYYLTLKPLSPRMPTSWRHFPAWDCTGGDIL